MNEAFVMAYLPGRAKQLGYRNYHTRFREFPVEANAVLEIRAADELYFLTGEPQGIVIRSGYGRYDSTGVQVFENIYQHRGQIRIENRNDSLVRVRFIQAILVN